MTTANTTWRVRSEAGVGEGRAIEFKHLAQAVADGVVTQTAQVRGPQDSRWSLVGDHPLLEEFLPPQPLFRSRSADEAEMDMTPMIDVTFQLLIFFMITAAFVTQKTLNMPQPGAAKEGRASVAILKDEVVVKLEKNGAIKVKDKPVTIDEYPAALRDAMKDHTNAEIFLDVEDDVEQESLVQVIDGAAGLQIEKIHFLRRVPPAGSTKPG
jgi:biopolymer transport protein ExbD